MTNVEYLRNNFPLLKNKSDNSIIMMIDRISYSACPISGGPPSCHECGSCYVMFLEGEVDNSSDIDNLGKKLENYITQHEYN
jgi:hypothetical protein